MKRLFTLALLVGFTISAKAQTVLVFDYPVTQQLYIPGSYEGRSFFYDDDHLGEDIDLPEGTPVMAVADGELIYYKTDSAAPDGFGNLYAITRHDFGQEYIFLNAYGQEVQTRYVCVIYGHIRNTPAFQGPVETALQWPRNYDNPTENHPDLPVAVSRSDVLGYIERSSHPDDQPIDPNGDGLEHGHFGACLSYNPIAPFGYEGTSK